MKKVIGIVLAVAVVAAASVGGYFLLSRPFAPAPETPADAPPVAVITINSIEELTVSFSGADSTGEIVTYEWQFGDGTLGFGVTTTHTYADSGVYTVTLKAYGTEASGLTNTASTTVEVTAPVIPDVPFLVSVSPFPGFDDVWRITFDSVPTFLFAESVSITIFAANGAVLQAEIPIECYRDPLRVCTQGIHVIHHHLGGYTGSDTSGYIAVGDYISLRMSVFPSGSTFTLSAFSEVLVSGTFPEPPPEPPAAEFIVSVTQDADAWKFLFEKVPTLLITEVTFMVYDETRKLVVFSAPIGSFPPHLAAYIKPVQGSAYIEVGDYILLFKFEDYFAAGYTFNFVETATSEVLVTGTLP